MGKIQFGLVIPSGSRDKAQSGAYMDNVRRLTELGTGHYDSAWFVDHLQFDDADLMEGWTAVTYLAALNPQFKWGHAVLCQSFRNPALLAKMAATLQYMSGGRFILGLGAGWKEDEYLSYGYDYPPAGTRVEELEETLQIVKALWTEERATVRGKHYRVEEAWCEPKPDPRYRNIVQRKQKGAHRPPSALDGRDCGAGQRPAFRAGITSLMSSSAVVRRGKPPQWSIK